MSALGAAATAPLRRRVRQRVDGWRAIDWICLAAIVVLAAMAVLGPLIAPHDPNALNVIEANAGPSLSHPLGTDAVGRDLLSRLIDGARASLIGPLAVSALATGAGTVLGLAAGWRGGWFDQAVTAVANAALAFPGLLLAILSVAVFGRGLTAPVVALAVAYTPYCTRVVRAAALRERRLLYVEALRAQGFSALSINLRHVLPALMPIVVAQATVGIGYAMVDLAAVSFLGLGIQPPAADWGSMVAGGQTLILQGHPMQSLSAGALIVIAVMAVTILGERTASRAEAGR